MKNAKNAETPVILGGETTSDPPKREKDRITSETTKTPHSNTSSFYTLEELKEIGLKSYGRNVLISRKASIYGASNVSLGNNVRIDDFCIVSGKVELGNNIHVAAYSALYGGVAGITISDYANISSRVCVYAVSDDFSGYTMTNPTIPDKYKHIQNEPVFIGKHVIIGSGSTILPGITLAEGSALGAMTLCKESTEPWKIYIGIPARCLKERKKELLIFEEEYRNEDDESGEAHTE